jgi:hypothetical protein
MDRRAHGDRRVIMLSPPNSNTPKITSAASTSLVRLSPLAYEHITLTGRYHLISPS